MNKMQISSNSLKILKDKKNLLAFSFGVDSAGLYHILREKNINFDIALVNYQLRKQANTEMKEAIKLAKLHDKTAFIATCKLNLANFEKKARDFRYNFFENIIKTNNYDNLITAHQLNDKLEWFFMQFCKGSGSVELGGFDEITHKKNYKLIRPLINISKNEILDYLKKNNFLYFIDESNFSSQHKRNNFRSLSDNLIKEYKKGIIQSFLYLKTDKLSLIDEFIYHDENLYIFKRKNLTFDKRMLSIAAKNLGFLLSVDQQLEAIKQQNGIISKNLAFGFNLNFAYICIANDTKMTKNFKELARINNIPPKIRPNLYEKYLINNSFFQNLLNLLNLHS